jgi:hypothetical protein
MVPREGVIDLAPVNELFLARRHIQAVLAHSLRQNLVLYRERWRRLPEIVQAPGFGSEEIREQPAALWVAYKNARAIGQLQRWRSLGPYRKHQPAPERGPVGHQESL